MIVRANAKINLTLDIEKKRGDGYHDLSTVMQSLNLCDEIELTKNKNGIIKVSCNRRGVPTDERNTAYKAARSVLDYTGISDMGVNIYIDKTIPMEAGMGGGSADAAAVIHGLIKLFDLQITDSVLNELAASIGADVPFCMVGGTCLCRGIGDEVSPVDPMPQCTILVCKPPVGVSTAEAYAESDKFPQEDNFMTAGLVEALKTEDIHVVAAHLSNRFDDILQIPEVQIIKSIMCENGALNASMTGSGSAVYGIFSDDRLALSTAEMLRDYGEVFIAAPETAGTF